MARTGKIERDPLLLANPGYQRYLDLVARVDGFLAAVRERYGDRIRCPEGCADCCQTDLSLWPIEAYHLARGMRSLCASELDRLSVEARGRESERCPLLVENRCALYDYRPILCRTHGFPFLSRQEEVGKEALFGYCPRSLQVENGKISWDGDLLLDLDVLNRVLAAVNQLFLQGLSIPHACREPVRIRVADLLAVGKREEGSPGERLSLLLQEKTRP